MALVRRSSWVSKALFVTLGLLLLAGLPRAAEIPARRPAAPAAALPQVRLGAYLASLYDIDEDKGAFSADLWIWTHTPKAMRYEMAKSLEVNYLSIQQPPDYSGDYRTGDGQADGWLLQQRKLRGIFLHTFDASRFPFDRQVLQVHFEDNTDNADKVGYVPDPRTDYDHGISLNGWKISRVSLAGSPKAYGTNFGDDTNSSDQRYSRLTLSVEIHRNGSRILIKVMLGLWIAVVVSLCSAFMRTETGDIFSGRMGLLSGALIAAVVNMQFADGGHGSITTVTLVDKLHFVGLMVILALMLLTLFSRAMVELKRETAAVRRMEMRFLVALSIFFVLANVLLVAWAA